MTNPDPATPKVPASEPELRWTARGAAAYMIPVGIGGMWWNYHLIHAQREYWVKLALIAPAILVLGLFFLIFPDEDPMEAPRFRDFSLGQWLSYVFAIGAAFGNWYALSHGLYP